MPTFDKNKFLGTDPASNSTPKFDKSAFFSIGENIPKQGTSDSSIQQIISKIEVAKKEAEDLGYKTKDEIAKYVKSSIEDEPSSISALEQFARGFTSGFSPLPKSATSQLNQLGAAMGAAPGSDPSAVAQEERVQERLSQDQGGFSRGAGEVLGNAAGAVGTAGVMAQKAVQKLGGKALATAVGSVVPRVVGGVTTGLASSVQQERIKSVDDFKEEIKQIGITNALFEGALATAGGVKFLGTKAIGALSPTTKRIEQTVGLGAVREARPQPLTLKQEAIKAQQTRQDPFYAAADEYLKATNTIKEGTQRDLAEIGLKAKDELVNVKKKIQSVYSVEAGPILKQFGNQPIETGPIYNRVLELFQERSILTRVQDGTYRLSEKEGQKAFGNAFGEIRGLFEELGGLTPINSKEAIPLNKLTLNQLRNRQTALETLSDFAQNGDVGTGAAMQVGDEISKTMTTAYPSLSTANENYTNSIKALGRAKQAINSSDIGVGKKILNLEDPKNAAALEAVEALKDLSPNISRLMDNAAEKGVPLKMLADITKASDRGGIEGAFLRMGQSEIQALSNAARKFPQLVPLARNAKAAAEARQLWLEVKNEAFEASAAVGLLGGLRPVFKLPDKLIAKMAIWIDSNPFYAKTIAGKSGDFAAKVLKSPRPRTAFKLWARTKEGQATILDALENPWWEKLDQAPQKVEAAPQEESGVGKKRTF